MMSSSFFPRILGPQDAKLWSIRLDAATDTGMTLTEWIDGVDQARDLGAETVVILIDELKLDARPMDLMRHFRSQGMNVWLYANTPTFPENALAEAYDLGVSLVLRLTADAGDVHRWLSGDQAACPGFAKAFETARRVGYPDDERVLGVHFSLCPDRAAIAESLRQYLTSLSAQPMFDLALERRRGGRTGDDQRRRSTGINWAEFAFSESDCRPPLGAQQLAVEARTVFVDVKGTVFPSERLPIPIGSLGDQRLADIIGESEIIEDLLRHARTIKDPCRTCDHADHCFGSRIAAHHLTGDYLASDPTCWKNKGKEDQIRRLPIPLHDLIPHQSTMRLVDTLESIGERCGTVVTTIRPDMPMVNGDGVFDDVFLLEMMAQGMAGVTHFKKHDSAEREVEGFLLGAHDVRFFNRVQVGDRLTVKVRKYARYGAFGMIKGRIERHGELVAQGNLKFWHRVELVSGGKGDET